MIQWIARGLLVCASLFAVSVYAAGGTYELQLQVERNGIGMVDTGVEVNAGVDADLQIVDENRDRSQSDTRVGTTVNTDASVRIIVQLKRADEIETDGDIAVKLQFFEKQRGGWSLVGEPSFVSAPGEKSTISFSNDFANSSGNFDHYKISITAAKKEPGSAQRG